MMLSKVDKIARWVFYRIRDELRRRFAITKFDLRLSEAVSDGHDHDPCSARCQSDNQATTIKYKDRWGRPRRLRSVEGRG
jgi:hypothetical protein